MARSQRQESACLFFQKEVGLQAQDNLPSFLFLTFFCTWVWGIEHRSYALGASTFTTERWSEHDSTSLEAEKEMIWSKLYQ